MKTYLFYKVNYNIHKLKSMFFFVIRDKESVCSQFNSNDNYRGLRNWLFDAKDLCGQWRCKSKKERKNKIDL